MSATSSGGSGGDISSSTGTGELPPIDIGFIIESVVLCVSALVFAVLYLIYMWKEPPPIPHGATSHSPVLRGVALSNFPYWGRRMGFVFSVCMIGQGVDSLRGLRLYNGGVRAAWAIASDSMALMLGAGWVFSITELLYRQMHGNAKRYPVWFRNSLFLMAPYFAVSSTIIILVCFGLDRVSIPWFQINLCFAGAVDVALIIFGYLALRSELSRFITAREMAARSASHGLTLDSSPIRKSLKTLFTFTAVVSVAALFSISFLLRAVVLESDLDAKFTTDPPLKFSSVRAIPTWILWVVDTAVVWYTSPFRVTQIGGAVHPAPYNARGSIAAGTGMGMTSARSPNGSAGALLTRPPSTGRLTTAGQTPRATSMGPAAPSAGGVAVAGTGTLTGTATAAAVTGLGTSSGPNSASTSPTNPSQPRVISSAHRHADSRGLLTVPGTSTPPLLSGSGGSAGVSPRWATVTSQLSPTQLVVPISGGNFPRIGTPVPVTPAVTVLQVPTLDSVIPVSVSGAPPLHPPPPRKPNELPSAPVIAITVDRPL